MNTIAQTVALIEDAQASSAQCWEMAVATDDSDRGFQADYDECDDEYDSAIAALTDAYEGYIRTARIHLENARRLEVSGGDDQHARRALAALDELDPDADR